MWTHTILEWFGNSVRCAARKLCVSPFSFLLAGLVGLAPVAAQEGTPKKGPVLLANRVLDARTVIAPSRIPKSGMGLFARERIKEGEIIGELGGQLVEAPDLENPSAYLAGLPDCAFMKVPPYRYLDSKDYGGNVSRANFAPRAINGKETGFQNAKIDRVCDSPYVVFVATKDIEPGQEIWTSYGPHYFYERFMFDPAVRDFFCGLAGVECIKEYVYEH